MCHIITTYHCAHVSLDKRHHCKGYQHRLKQAKRQPNPGLFSCFFPSPRKRITCTAPPGKEVVLDLCPDCKAARVLADIELAAKRAREARESQEWDAIREEQIAKARRDKERATYRCSRCITEGREPDARNRAANSGLCCARGLAEYADQKKTWIPRPQAGSSRRPVERGRMKEELVPQPQAASSRKPMQREQKREDRIPRLQAGTSRKPVQSPQTREQRIPELRRKKSQEMLRSEATRAAESYGWNRQQRDSTYLEPGLVKQYMNTPGADIRAVGKGPPVPEPLYEEPAIDWDQWWTAKQGPHGRMPPMPEGQLPVRPLKTRRGQTVRSIDRKPVPIRKHSGRSRRQHEEPVSPLLSPILSNPSPVSPIGRTDDLMSDLDEHLADAMDYWQPPPIATPAPAYRQPKWR